MHLMIKNSKTPINTLIFSASQNDSEAVASKLKNQGLPIRHSVVTNSEALKEFLDKKQWQQAIFLEVLPNLPIEQSLQLLKTQPTSIPTILLSQSYDQELRTKVLSKGVNDCVPDDAFELLSHIIRREQASVNFQQQLHSANKLVKETSKRNDLLLR